MNDLRKNSDPSDTPPDVRDTLKELELDKTSHASLAIRERNRNFQNIFRLPESVTLLSNLFPLGCTMEGKGVNSVSGNLYLSQEFLCFASCTKGNTKMNIILKVVLPFVKIKRIQRNEPIFGIFRRSGSFCVVVESGREFVFTPLVADESLVTLVFFLILKKKFNNLFFINSFIYFFIGRTNLFHYFPPKRPPRYSLFPPNCRLPSHPHPPSFFPPFLSHSKSGRRRGGGE